MSLKLELPTLQNWSCHNCGGCCKQHAITITDAERQRILAQSWIAGESGLTSSEVINNVGSSGRPLWQLAHQPDGSCVFLTETGLCRIHARFGEAAKPLACRIYPYTFHPFENQIRIGYRYSCPSVVKNLGETAAQSQKSLYELAKLAVPNDSRDFEPPLFADGFPLDWNETQDLLKLLDLFLATPKTSVVLKLLWCLGLLKLIETSRVDGQRHIPNVAFKDLAFAYAVGIQRELPTLPSPVRSPPSMIKRLFRMMAAQYARRDTNESNQKTVKFRGFLLLSIIRVASGWGRFPAFQSGFAPVSMKQLETPVGPYPREVDELLTRYLRTKVTSFQFCGPAFFHYSFVDGFAALGLAIASVFYLARQKMHTEKRTKWTLGDFETALSAVDHNYGFCGAFALPNIKQQSQLIWKSQEVTRLVAWYAQ